MKRGQLFLLTAIALVSLVLPWSAEAQLSVGGAPRSFLYSVSHLPETVIKLAAPDLSDEKINDSLYPSPYCFGVVLPVSVDCESTGVWSSLPDDSQLWRVMIKSPGALAITAYFDKFFIPEGGRLFLYNPDRSQVIGAFTSQNNSQSGYFATELIKGDEVILEYSGPAGVENRPHLRVNEIAYAYRGVNFMEDDLDNTNLVPCEVNVNCPEGNYWQYQKDGVARLQVKRDGHTYWCSGSVINNVKQDRTPYLLTANHCGFNSTDAELQLWVFYFNYEAPSCTSKYPVPRTMTGAVKKAQSGGQEIAGSDFFLVQLNQMIPDSFHVFYNGWSRLETPVSNNGVGIHHPNGDLKKISTYTTPLVSAIWEGGNNQTHWKVTWSETVSGFGVTEGGSSGSPIFDEEGRVVGTLSGGLSACDSASRTQPDYYGKFSFSWASNGNTPTTRLRDWLDPENTNPTTLEGVYLGIDDPTSARSFSVYPNPFEDVLNLKHGIVKGKVTITISDLTGRIVLTQVANSSSESVIPVDCRTLTAGLYLMRIEGTSFSQTIKILKQ